MIEFLKTFPSMHTVNKLSAAAVQTSVHLLPSAAIHSVAFSGKSFFMLDSSLEMHALITSPSERFGISMCSMVLQKQQIKNVVTKHSPFIWLQNEAPICILATFLF